MSHIVQKIRLVRKPEVLDIFPVSNSTLYIQIDEGLFVPSVSLGERAVGWFLHEVQQIIVAKAAGQSKEEIRQLVSDLVVQRSDLMEMHHG